MGNTFAGYNLTCRKRGMGYYPTIIFVRVAMFMLIMGVGGCKSAEDKETHEDVLMMFDDKVLTFRDVENGIPVGIDSADSIALFDAIVENWIKSSVVKDLAEKKLPNMDEIDHKVENYRNRLIVAEYLQQMKESQQVNVSEDSVRMYYDAHRTELLTESPLVKGIFMKIQAGSAHLEEIRQLLFSGKDEDVDKLEKSWMETALQYDYFGGNWLDFQILANQIPYRFHDPDGFLKSNSNFETTYNGSTYLFHVYDYIASGNVQPYEFASGKIAEILVQSKIAAYEKALVASLIKKALREKRLVAVGYDPVRHRMVSDKNNKNKRKSDNEKE